MQDGITATVAKAIDYVIPAARMCAMMVTVCVPCQHEQRWTPLYLGFARSRGRPVNWVSILRRQIQVVHHAAKLSHLGRVRHCPFLLHPRGDGDTNLPRTPASCNAMTGARVEARVVRGGSHYAVLVPRHSNTATI